MITDQIGEEQQFPPLPQQVQSGLAEVRAKATDIERHARTWIQQRPVVAVLTALGVGYLVARVVSGSRR